ncbi:hypothetical protein PLICRDRAFT_84738, partial [Plicaturopsis crispa FD-325 SS-3]
VRRAVLAAIASDSYLVRLPDVSHTSWVKYDWFERKRLDYLGDGLMYAFVAEALIEIYPNEGSNFYSVLRQVLVQNLTFAALVEKAGGWHPHWEIKRAGDFFEGLIGNFKAAHGFDAAYQYVRETFAPLIVAACKAWDKAYVLVPREKSLCYDVNQARCLD